MSYIDLQFILKVIDVLEMIAIIGRFTADERVRMCEDFCVRQTIVVIVIGSGKQMCHFVRSYFAIGSMLKRELEVMENEVCFVLKFD